MLHDCHVSPDTTVLHVMLQAKSTQLLLIHPSVLYFCKTVVIFFFPFNLLQPLDTRLSLHSSGQKKYLLEEPYNWNILQFV